MESDQPIVQQGTFNQNAAWTNIVVLRLLDTRIEMFDPDKSNEPIKVYQLNEAKHTEESPSVVKFDEQDKERLMSHIHSLEGITPDYPKDELTLLACQHYNALNEGKWVYGETITADGNSQLEPIHPLLKATPASFGLFLDRITVDYLDHQLTCYATELKKCEDSTVFEAHTLQMKEIHGKMDEAVQSIKTRVRTTIQNRRTNLTRGSIGQ